MRRVNDESLALIKSWEGLRLNAYKDSGGILTIGYGHTSAAGEPKVVEGMTIDESYAERILRKDLNHFQNAVTKYVKVSLNDNQFSALVSFCFNVGVPQFSKSTLVKKLNRGDYSAVPNELAKWVFVKGKRDDGLVNRRAVESGLWSKGSYVSSNYQKVEKDLDVKPLKTEAVAPVVSVASGVGHLFVGQGPVQWALAITIVIAALVSSVLVFKRYLKS